MPSVVNAKIPALNGVTVSEHLAQNLQAKHEVRKAFIESEASEKIRRALRKNIRESNSAIFEAGEKVYYKRQDSEYWRGPAVVIGKDEHQVVLKHGGLFVRVHPVSLKKIHPSNEEIKQPPNVRQTSEAHTSKQVISHDVSHVLKPDSKTHRRRVY